MRVAVIGAGAVGGTIANLLAQAGHIVSVTARGEHLSAIQQNGLSLTGAWGSHIARVNAEEQLSRVPELAFVTTKAQDADAALSANSAMLAGIPIVVVQNGLESVHAAKQILPTSITIGGIALFAASYLSPGNVAVTTSGPTYLGGSGEATSVRAVADVERILGGAMPVKTTSNFRGAQWTKLVVNQINALPAITGLSAQAVIGDRKLRRIMTASMREAVSIGLANGITFEPLQGLSHGMLRLFSRLGLWPGQLLPTVMKWRMGPTPNPGSTLQSIRRGQSTEIDYLNGAVVRAGDAVGVPAPINSALVGMVHEVERTGVFLTTEAVTSTISIGTYR